MGGVEQTMESGLSGSVLETMNAGRYTYVRIQQDGKDVWAAGPMTEVAVGDKVQLAPGMAMENFESPTLKRTFERVLFVPAIQVEGKPAAAVSPPVVMPNDATHAGVAAGGLPAGHPTIPGMDASTPPQAPEGEALLTGTVLQTMNASKYTYIEVKTEQGTRWLAAPQTTLAAGSEIKFPAGMEMQNFESPSIGRKFDSIYFVGGVYPVVK
ncbi:MAG: GW dipeptide domain-containing protein [Lentisphaerae bacterium]|nr:GW dipeptide domain-containing protein [Lentisphaerota bacterium]